MNPYAWLADRVPVHRRGQKVASVPRIGHLGTSSACLEPRYLEAFRVQLGDLGYIEHQHVAIKYRRAAGRNDRLRNPAAGLARLRPVVIATTGTPGAVAAQGKR